MYIHVISYGVMCVRELVFSSGRLSKSSCMCVYMYMRIAVCVLNPESSLHYRAVEHLKY